MDLLKRHWLPIVAVLAVALLGAGTGAALLDTDDKERTRAGAPATPGADSELPQASWTIKTFAAGTAGPPKKAHRKAVEREKQRLIRTVTAVADTLLYSPESISQLAGKELSRSAAKALASSALALPEDLEDVQAIRRAAHIGLDANGGRRAAARITALVKGEMNGAPVKIAGDSRLYLQKGPKGWQVVAFDASFAPKEKGGDGKSKSGAKTGAKSKKKKGKS